MKNKISIFRSRQGAKKSFFRFDQSGQGRYAKSQLKNHRYISQEISKNMVDSKNSTHIKFAIHKRNTTYLFPAKSQLHFVKRQIPKKANIMSRKKSFTLLQKNRSYSIDRTFNKQLRESHKSINLQNGISKEQIMLTFAGLCYRIQEQFRDNCEKGQFNKAYENLVTLLNHSVDISCMRYFFKIIYTMCQFFEILQKNEVALKFYTQLQQASILLKNYEYLIISLIGISKCAGHANLYGQSILILKKALEYSWYINSSQLEVNIYDEMGEKYYKLGDLDRAHIYHIKYANAVLEEEKSPLRTLSNKQIQIVQSINVTQTYQNVSQYLLAHLNLPIKNTSKLSPLIPSLFTVRENISETTLKPVNQIGYYDGIDHQIKRILTHWIFSSQTEEPNLQRVKLLEAKKSSIYSTRKFALIDFKMNQHLKRKGIEMHKSKSFITDKSPQLRQQVKKKESLDQKIHRMLQSPGLEKQWYSNMVKRVQNDQKRKQIHICDPVRLTRNHSKSNQKQQLLKNLYKQIIQFIDNRKFNGN